MAVKLEAEFEWYIAHQDDLVKKYDGKFLAIKDRQVLGAYNYDIAAIETTMKQHKLGTFLVHKCGPGVENYTRTCHLREAFV